MNIKKMGVYTLGSYLLLAPLQSCSYNSQLKPNYKPCEICSKDANSANLSNTEREAIVRFISSAKAGKELIIRKKGKVNLNLEKEISDWVGSNATVESSIQLNDNDQICAYYDIIKK